MFNVSVLSWPCPSAAPPTDVHVWVCTLAAFHCLHDTISNLNCAFTLCFLKDHLFLALVPHAATSWCFSTKGCVSKVRICYKALNFTIKCLSTQLRWMFIPNALLFLELRSYTCANFRRKNLSLTTPSPNTRISSFSEEKALLWINYLTSTESTERPRCCVVARPCENMSLLHPS